MERRPHSERGNGSREGARVARLALALACGALVLTCGRKTNPRPRELVAPRPVSALSLVTQANGVALRWSRPTQYADGSRMEDLGGFVVERSRFNSPFTEIARVPVTDRGRFQKAKRFDYLDTEMLPGATYHYRIVAFTTDGYASPPSGAATITWQERTSPSPAPSPGAGTATAAPTPYARPERP